MNAGGLARGRRSSSEEGRGEGDEAPGDETEPSRDETEPEPSVDEPSRAGFVSESALESIFASFGSPVASFVSFASLRAEGPEGG